MLGDDPRLVLHRDDRGELLAVLEYAEPPRVMLFVAIACEQALAASAGAPTFLSMPIEGVGRRTWRIALDPETRELKVTRDEIPAILRSDEDAAIEATR